ncbi:hypothetical protein IMG5_027090 [Ichthyophthirius multifiliis]|uniref:Uncharacterized protein n=1 Tax=Ichthyophthirius multifiliis TaxID=5932 RepID=G0QL82_ICHMU|nr:hypothetical protein IMG5_027090 [Ichthyophthirius multifiliis]EGR34011.1 hypothetical protein IMG5_027090 [Ichthyophthirius multifiliis]|eukprot:XP_004039315.1 hypothetical protein IMG5_027090 [Ichthyophthirius multifiliis]
MICISIFISLNSNICIISYKSSKNTRYNKTINFKAYKNEYIGLNSTLNYYCYLLKTYQSKKSCIQTTTQTQQQIFRFINSAKTGNYRNRACNSYTKRQYNWIYHMQRSEQQRRRQTQTGHCKSVGENSCGRIS